MSEQTTGSSEDQFIGLISLLANMAMQQLGRIINPLTAQTDRQLEAARMTIDLLKMLHVKTAGNLSREEIDILDSHISNLQINYLDELKQENNSGSMPVLDRSTAESQTQSDAEPSGRA